MASPQSSWGPDDPLRGWVDDDLADRLAGEERVDIDLTAADLAVAEWARSGWRDRLARDVGQAVSVQLDTTTVHADLVELFADGLLLATATPGPAAGDRAPGDWVVAWHAVRTIGPSVAPSGGPGDRVRDRPAMPRPAARVRPARAQLRQWAAAGERVAVTLGAGQVVVGRLGVVTGDTLDLRAGFSGEEAPGSADRLLTLPWHAVSVVRLTDGSP